MLSTSACQLASMTLCETPTVLQRSWSSPDSMSTRTTAAVPSAAAEHAHLVVVQAHVLDLGVELPERLAQRLVERVDRAVALRRRVLDRAVRALEHDRGLGDRRLVLVPLLVDDAEADQPEEARAVAVERLAHQQLERCVRPLERVARAPRAPSAPGADGLHARPVALGGRCRTRPPWRAGWSGRAEIGDQDALHVADQRGVDVLVGLRVLLHRRHVQPALVREGALRRRRPGACSARGWRARRPGGRPPPGWRAARG